MNLFQAISLFIIVAFLFYVVYKVLKMDDSLITK